jgi:NDP-sugar pyrophosphorylase family protein
MSTMPAVALLAGGLATRLRPLTEQIPKSMLLVADEPFIAHQLRMLCRQGIRHVVLCVGHLWEQIEAFVGDGSRFGLSVAYSLDGPQLLGTGGAVRAALARLGSEFLVMYGDSWLDAAYGPIIEAFRDSRQPALTTVYRNDGQWDRSNVWFEEGRIRLYDKQTYLPQMHHIDWGLSVLSTDIVAKAHPAGVPFDLGDIYRDLSRGGRLAGHEVTIRFYEIGSVEGLRETDALLRGSYNT